MSVENVPLLNELPRLPQSIIDEFQENGHVIIRNVATAEEIMFFQAYIRKAVSVVREEGERQHFGKGKAFPRVINMWEICEFVKQWTCSRRFAKMAAELMGVDGVRIYQDSALFALPGDVGTPWHTDNEFMLKFDPDHVITMWMPLMDLPDSMTFLSKSHLEESGNFMSMARKGLKMTSHGPMSPGDVTFHSGNTYHFAKKNDLSKEREVITVVFFEDGARLIEEGNDPNKLVHWKRIFPGLPQGERAASPYTPVLYCNKPTI